MEAVPDDSLAMQQFVAIDLGREPIPDEATINRLHHLLETLPLGQQVFARIREYLTTQGRQMSQDSAMDATISSVLSSANSRTKKQNALRGASWVDSQTERVHSVAATANRHNRRMLPELLHRQKTKMRETQRIVGNVIRRHAPKARSFIQANAHRHRPLSEEKRTRNRTKSKVPAKIEHVFLVIKHIFRWANVRYRGLANLYFIVQRTSLVIRKQHTKLHDQGPSNGNPLLLPT